MQASKLFIAAAALALSASAFAQAAPNSGEGYQADLSFQSSRSRDDVKAELAAARRNGQVFSGDNYPAAPIASGPAKTRAQVQAEFVQAKALGQLRHED
ncbi:DUF4148 domain-containing protein [Pseudoduganella rhizocola]|uniref:DUF4148 domain-containing protein n=1 Tax=Pseudoduganella rhizocola TaxID=3382643 RepID=UPI0038B60E39